jgi:hypothetical protein
MLLYTGIINPLAKGTHRNRQCFCGSKKKLKKCHGAFEFLGKDVEANDVYHAYDLYLRGQMDVQEWNGFVNFVNKREEDKVKIEKVEDDS